MKAVVIALGIWMVTLGQSSAQAVRTGNDLREVCEISDRGPKTDLEVVQSTYCTGFVAAILLVGERFSEPDRFCPPGGVTVAQATSVLVKYLRGHPEITDRPAEDLTIAALSKAWRCK
jgi:Rap1a immunity proteins